MVGSFDAGYGTWYLEDTIGRKRAKEMWYLNRKYTAAAGARDGPGQRGRAGGAPAAQRAQRWPRRSPPAARWRSPGIKGAFSARHHGVAGQARMAHDQQLTLYLQTQEAHEVTDAFGERRAPDPERFWS